MQVVLCATLYHLYCVLEDLRVATDTLVYNFLLVFRFQPLFHWH